jgi:protein-S-isoprenylcysteine O-methyltransferase Ste14
MIIPVIVTGLFVGSILKSSTHSASKKKLLSVSTLSGVLNGAFAYVVYLFTPSPTTTFARAAAFATRQTSDLPFVLSSALAGFLIVLVIVGIAMLYARSRTHEEGSESEEAASQEALA